MARISTVREGEAGAAVWGRRIVGKVEALIPTPILILILATDPAASWDPHAASEEE
jgi:hypothetical protein